MQLYLNLRIFIMHIYIRLGIIHETLHFFEHAWKHASKHISQNECIHINKHAYLYCLHVIMNLKHRGNPLAAKNLHEPV